MELMGCLFKIGEIASLVFWLWKPNVGGWILLSLLCLQFVFVKVANEGKRKWLSKHTDILEHFLPSPLHVELLVNHSVFFIYNVGGRMLSAYYSLLRLAGIGVGIYFLCTGRYVPAALCIPVYLLAAYISAYHNPLSVWKSSAEKDPRWIPVVMAAHELLMMVETRDQSLQSALALIRETEKDKTSLL